MKLEGFRAEADIVGTRLKVVWTFLLEGTDTLADIPPVKLHRKQRDFEFPTPFGGLDPFLLYDSASFPPAPSPGVTVIDLPGWETYEAGWRTVVTVISVARNISGQVMETLRCTTFTSTDPDGRPVQRRVEILDPGGPPGGLAPGTTFYYQISSPKITGTADQDGSPYRTTATATARYGLNRVLYELLPNIYRRFDVIQRQTIPGAAGVPEIAPHSGQLRRFLDMFGIALDHMRSTAEGLLNLRDIDNVDYRFLPLLAQMIGWDLSFEAAIPLRRNEIKSAVRLYKGVGTIPAIRAIVSRYTGWYTQVAEFAQSLVRSNLAPQLNIWAARERAGEWVAIAEAAYALGFGPGNQQALGGPGLPAKLTSTGSEPFALQPGMELTITVDSLTPQIVRFGPEDFTGIGAATAAEVCTVMNRTLSGIEAEAVGGQISLRSETAGSSSALTVVPAAAGLVSLESAPRGRLSAFPDHLGRVRLFYQADDSSPAAGDNPARLRYKCFAYGVWGNSHPVADSVQGEPAALELPDQRVCLAWVENPNTNMSRLRSLTGTVPPPQPAKLLGHLQEPFAITPGTTLTLRGNWTGTDTATFTMGDFADPQHATAAEVVTALNAQLLRAVANVNAAGNIQLQSNDTGPAAWLEIDLRESWGIQSIGLPSHSIRVRGSWDEAIAWQIPQEVTFPGRHADVHAIVDQAGGLRLFWSMHRQNVWRLVSCRWDDRIWIATAAGVSLQQAGGGWVNFTTGDGLASNDVRAVAADADGSIWAATSAGVSVRRPTGVWNIFTAAPNGLAHNDVRGLALAPDGARWFATAAGVSTLKEDGTWKTFTTSDGLVSNDIQSATVAPDGSVWLATPLGVNVRWPNGMWEKFTDEDGLGDKNVRQVAMAPDGSVWFATLGGVSVRNPAGGWKTFTAADGLASNDVRGVALATAGEVWLATAAGVSSRQADGRWTTFTTADGLVSHDTRSVMLAADGLIWVATSQGISVRQPDKTWTKIDLSGGLPSQDIRSIWGSWSAFRELAAGQGGNREPCVLRDSTDRLWLFWSQRLKAGTGDDIWTLRRRRFDPATLTWEAETQVLAPVGTSSDRQPGGVLLPSGDLRLFFTSNRSGGTDIWSVTVASTGAVSGLGLVIPGPAADSAPAPALVNGAVWLLFRSDRSVSLAQVGNPPSVSGSWSSLRVPDAGTVRRFAGGTSVVLGDLGRIGRRRQWDDLLAYTPVDPGHERQLKNDELYTRGTIGLYVSSTNSGMALSQENVIRLRQLLARFLPINVRAVVILASPGFREVIYSSGADLGESYFDDYPFADYYTGLTDAAAARPDWTQLHANTPGEVSVDPAEPATIRGRTYFPPPQ